VAEVTPFTIIPAPRCCEITSSSPLVICNRPASWMPILAPSGVTPFRCELHKQAGDTAIAGIAIVRRLSVVSQIVLASAVESDLLAKAEALARLERGVRAVGGILSLHTVHARTGPWAVPLAASDDNRKQGGG